MWLAKERGTHRLIGRAGIDYRMLGEEEIIEMGYVIAPEYQRQGYAYEVCQAIMAWVKNNLDFRRIDCLVEPGNEASLGLLHKLGFQETEKINQDGKIFRHFRYFYP
jgi:acetyltransferases, including N-acetylases of ribosomal proteins